MTTPEAFARQHIDELLTAAGWVVQSRAELNLGASRGVAVREFPLTTGFADYLLFVDRKALGAVEAKPRGATLTGVEAQSAKYGLGLPANLPALRRPLPFLYESTGVETFFTDGRDPAPRSRRVFAFHTPETLLEWAMQPQSLRARLQKMPALPIAGLWPAQVEAINNLERSLADDRPRALIQMATGSGKTFMAVNAIYRLVKFAGARRVLFLVDRANLGRQTLREFQQFVTPDDGRKFTELYNVQRLSTNVLDPVCRVSITTIQRLYAMLNNEPEYGEDKEEASAFDLDSVLNAPPKEVRYNPRIPVEYFDFIVTDECHRSIYHLWRQVLEYFDAYLIGLTATPSKQTFGFFHQNLVQEYTRQRAVADGVNVDGVVYRIRTQVPKTIIFAKDDAHAEEIVRIVREEFGKGNDFCKKITYRVTGVDPETLIAQFRNSYDPRIAVTVDMISTGTDIKPVEVLLFMRAVQSRVLYEQMIGRGTRVISATDLQAVTSDAAAKTHYVIVDAVGITEDPKVETTTLERKPSAPLAKLLEAVAQGIRDDDMLSTLAGRLTRLARRATPQDAYTVAALAAGATLNDLANRLLDAIDPDQPLTVDADVGAHGCAPLTDPLHRIDEACAPFDDPKLRKALVEMQVRNEQTIDAISIDRVTEVRFVQSDQARTTVASFRAYLEQHKDEITALQLIYSRPYAQRALTYRQVKDLAEQLRLADQSWTTESLWMAYAQVEQDRVRGVGAQRVLADLVSLVRHAVQLDDELVPYPERVARRYAEWMADQEAQGRTFTPEQRWWLDGIARHIGVNLAISPDDLSAPPFFDRGGLFGAARVLGPNVRRVLEEMNEALAV